MVAVADIDVVDTDRTALPVVGQLQPSADLIRDGSRINQAELVRELIGIALRMRGVGLPRIRRRAVVMVVTDLREHGDSRQIGEPHGVFLVIIDVIDQRRPRGKRISVELEPSAEWREFGRHRVAGLAGQTRLPGEWGNGACRLSEEHQR